MSGDLFPGPVPRGGGRWAIQLMAEVATIEDANDVLGGLKGQDGYLGGRTLTPSPSEPTWRVQAFFQDEPEAAANPEGLPDDMRRVFLPEGLARQLGIAPEG